MPNAVGSLFSPTLTSPHGSCRTFNERAQSQFSTTEAPMTAPATIPSTAGHGLQFSFPLPSTASLLADRRGRLRNGAQPGDFLAAPRCGARTRCGDACRQPAMPNRRCRMHGGLSTGPRTPEGRARCARACLKHGTYSAATRALMAEARAHLRRMRALLALNATAGHGVLRSQSKRTGGAPPCGRPADGTNGRPRPTSKPDIRVHLRSSAAKPLPTAGHGVLRSFSPSRASARAARLLTGTALRSLLSAGHGLLPPFPAAGLSRPSVMV